MPGNCSLGEVLSEDPSGKGAVGHFRLTTAAEDLGVSEG